MTVSMQGRLDIAAWSIDTRFCLGDIHIRLPEKGISNSHGARPAHQITSMIQWIRTSRLSVKNSLSARALDMATWSIDKRPYPSARCFLGEKW